MAVRSAPALGLAVACVLVTAVGLTTIGYASDGERLNYVGAVIGADPAHAGTPAASATRSPGSPTASRTPSRTASSRPSAPASSSPAAPLRTAPRSSSAPNYQQAPGTGSSANPDTALSYAVSVFQAINQSRSEQHLPPLIWSAKLHLSARKHNQAMAAANTLSHQVDGESRLGARETAARVRWSYAAENIGWTVARNRAGALAIENQMFNETPPSDAHRRNILSSAARAVGIDVLIDVEHGRLWLTEDFANAG